MAKKTINAEDIINKLREAEVLISQGKTIPEVSKELGVIDQTYYRWKKEYGGMRTDQAKRLKELEREIARLRKVVADLTLDMEILSFSDPECDWRVYPCMPGDPGGTQPERRGCPGVFDRPIMSTRRPSPYSFR